MSDIKTIEQIKSIIKTAKDSVWVINDEIQKKTQRGSLTDEGKVSIQRNVDHLVIVMADTEITGSGEDVSELVAAITAGKLALQ